MAYESEYIQLVLFLMQIKSVRSSSSVDALLLEELQPLQSSLPESDLSLPTERIFEMPDHIDLFFYVFHGRKVDYAKYAKEVLIGVAV